MKRFLNNRILFELLIYVASCRNIATISGLGAFAAGCITTAYAGDVKDPKQASCDSIIKMYKYMLVQHGERIEHVVV